jgi:NADH oxidase (H2O2-forming)
MNDIDPADRKKLIIIGGGAVGLAVATSVKRHSDYDVLVFSSDSHASYSQCGIPFVIAGDISDFNSLLLRSKEFFEEAGIDLRTGTTVQSVDLANRTVLADGENYNFDRLVIATGSTPSIPEELKAGALLENVFTVRTLQDGIRLEKALLKASNTVIIGGGAIGAELAAACSGRGLNTLLVSRSSSLLSHNIDPDMADIVREHLESLGVQILTDYAPQTLNGEDSVRSVTIGGKEFPAEVVIISAGVKPETKLAADAGIMTGPTGGIIINDDLQVKLTDGTYDPDVYCGGECAQLQDLITGRPLLSQLASTARRMAGVIRDNIIEEHSSFGPVISPWVAVIGELEVGTVGITTQVARLNGIDLVSGLATGTTSAGYYPGSTRLYIKLLFRNRILVGAQAIGGKGIKERIDGLSLAISKRTTVDELLNLETCYTPPLGTLVDPLTYAAKGALRKMSRVRK